MKKLEHGKATRRADGPSKTTTFSRRKFFKLGVGGTVLITSLGLGSLGTALLLPRSAEAAKAIEQKKVLGQKVTVVKLDKPLIELDEATEKYRGNEYFPDRTNKMKYQNVAQIQGEVTFLVSLHQDGKGRLTVAFPPEREDNPDARGAGIRGADLTKFARLVGALTGQRLTRVRIILDRGTTQYKGKTTAFTNAYMLPVDSNGNVTTNTGNGQYLVYGASYYADTVHSDIGLLVEPNNKTTMKVAQR